MRLQSRRQNDWTRKFPEVVAAAVQLPVQAALLDGEVAIVLPNGKTSSQALQNSFTGGAREGLVYFVFEILHLDEETWQPFRSKLGSDSALISCTAQKVRRACSATGSTSRSMEQPSSSAPARSARRVSSRKGGTRALSSWKERQLAKSQVSTPAGACDRRIHGSGRLPFGHRCVVGRSFRRHYAPLRRQGGDRPWLYCSISESSSARARGCAA